jgi:hypothetical protein
MTYFWLPALLVALGASGSPPPVQSELVISKKGSKEYHWPGCPVVKDGKDVLALTRAQATARGLQPHSACDPATAPEVGEPPEAEPPAIVYIDGSRYYHKKDCKKLGKDAKKIKLDDAGRKYWPCPVCGPPIRKRPGK